jgi:hypothetical protein
VVVILELVWGTLTGLAKVATAKAETMMKRIFVGIDRELRRILRGKSVRRAV